MKYAIRFKNVCGARDGIHGRCTLPPGHDTGGWHQEWRGRRLWAEWRGPMPDEVCRICHKDGRHHGLPSL